MKFIRNPTSKPDRRREARQAQIGEDLGFVEARERLDSFDLNDDRFVDDKIEAIARIERHPFIGDWQSDRLRTERPRSSNSWTRQCS